MTCNAAFTYIGPMRVQQFNVIFLILFTLLSSCSVVKRNGYYQTKKYSYGKHKLFSDRSTSSTRKSMILSGVKLPIKGETTSNRVIENAKTDGIHFDVPASTTEAKFEGAIAATVASPDHALSMSSEITQLPSARTFLHKQLSKVHNSQNDKWRLWWLIVSILGGLGVSLIGIQLIWQPANGSPL